MGRVILLGHQRLRPRVAAELTDAGIEGPLALVTAGWQERELEDEEVRAHVGRDTTNLALYGRWERVHVDDPEYFELHRARQDRLRQLQRLYRRRLTPAVDGLRALENRRESADLLASARAHALEQVRTLDDWALRESEAIHAEFEDRVRPAERPAIARQRKAIADVLRDSAALLIAGGHVAVLLNRLKLFDVAGALGDQLVVGWAAGAMTLTERVVLFHDSPPQGHGDAEVLESGLGLVPGVVALPHARTRLRLDDPFRVWLMAQRFAPAACLPLDDEDRAAWDGTQLHAERRLEARA
jgi:hypothetical protein